MMIAKIKNIAKKITINRFINNKLSISCFNFFILFSLVIFDDSIYIFLDFFQKFWNPLIVPLITILIISALVNGINSWWKRKLLYQEEDI